MDRALVAFILAGIGAAIIGSVYVLYGLLNLAARAINHHRRHP